MGTLKKKLINDEEYEYLRKTIPTVGFNPTFDHLPQELNHDSASSKNVWKNWSKEQQDDALAISGINSHTLNNHPELAVYEYTKVTDAPENSDAATADLKSAAVAAAPSAQAEPAPFPSPDRVKYGEKKWLDVYLVDLLTYNSPQLSFMEVYKLANEAAERKGAKWFMIRYKIIGSRRNDLAHRVRSCSARWTRIKNRQTSFDPARPAKKHQQSQSNGYDQDMAQPTRERSG